VVSAVTDLQQLAMRLVVLEGELPIEQATRRLGRSVESIADPCGPVLVRIEQPVQPLDPLQWLAAQTDDTRLFWGGRDCSVAGCGLAWESEAADLAQLDHLFRRATGPHQPDLRLMLTGRFDASRAPSNEWAPFGRVRTLLPLVELRQTGAGLTLACHIVLDQPGSDRRRALCDLLAATHAADATPLPATSWHHPTGEMTTRWSHGVEEILQEIRTGRIRKAVLARREPHASDTDLCPIRVLRGLATASAPAFRFCVQVRRQLAFVGASPELLYRRRGRDIETEALAGTRPRGGTSANDDELTSELRADAKEQREHTVVRDYIDQRLRPLCTELAVAPQPGVRKLGYVQHLCSTFRGILAAASGDGTVLSRLHPTPAVCGDPTAAALACIGGSEDFDRGLYGGPIGLLGRDTAECAVAIRSALVQRRELAVFAGAGIVEGSSPDAEWNETVSKMHAFAPLLGNP